MTIGINVDAVLEDLCKDFRDENGTPGKDLITDLLPDFILDVTPESFLSTLLDVDNEDSSYYSFTFHVHNMNYVRLVYNQNVFWVYERVLDSFLREDGIEMDDFLSAYHSKYPEESQARCPDYAECSLCAREDKLTKYLEL